MKQRLAELMKPGAVGRFFLVALAGTAVDYVLTMLLFMLTDLPLSVSAAIAFVTVGIVLYFVHEHWSFERENSKASAGRMGRTFLANFLAFWARVGLIAALEALYAPDALLGTVYYGMGAAASFTINYLAGRLWIFRDAPADSTASGG